MDFARLEHDIRRVPGVVACQLTPSDAIVLVGPDADPAEVQRRIELLLLSAVNAPALTVLGGNAPVLPFRRRHRGLVAVTAGAAALAAAGVAAAVTGVVAPSTSKRPSLGTAAAVGPPATVPGHTTDAGVPALRVERDEVGTAPTASASSETSDVQSLAQLATLGSPTLLVLPLPSPGATADAAPVRHRPHRHAPAAPVGGDGNNTTAAPATPPASPRPPDGTSTDGGSTLAAAPPPPPPSPPTLSSTPVGDEHDNDRGESSSDSNGHGEKGPQGHAYGQASGGERARPGR